MIISFVEQLSFRILTTTGDISLTSESSQFQRKILDIISVICKFHGTSSPLEICWNLTSSRYTYYSLQMNMKIAWRVVSTSSRRRGPSEHYGKTDVSLQNPRPLLPVLCCATDRYFHDPLKIDCPCHKKF